MAALTRIENWSKTEVDILIAKTKQDARNPKIHSEYHLYAFIYTLSPVSFVLHHSKVYDYWLVLADG